MFIVQHYSEPLILNVFAVHPLAAILSPHDVVVSVDGGSVSGPAEVSGVPHHSTAQAAPRVPGAVRRPSWNNLRTDTSRPPSN